MRFTQNFFFLCWKFSSAPPSLSGIIKNHWVSSSVFIGTNYLISAPLCDKLSLTKPIWNENKTIIFIKTSQVQTRTLQRFSSSVFPLSLTPSKKTSSHFPSSRAIQPGSRPAEPARSRRRGERAGPDWPRAGWWPGGCQWPRPPSDLRTGRRSRGPRGDVAAERWENISLPGRVRPETI